LLDPACGDENHFFLVRMKVKVMPLAREQSALDNRQLRRAGG
jgi:hypothetical protein